VEVALLGEGRVGEEALGGVGFAVGIERVVGRVKCVGIGGDV
jgi:histidyl-tRNA synthetase